MEGSNGLCICVVGLGYVGLPLAVEFGRVFDSVGYDMDVKRVEELKIGIDKTMEVSKDKIRGAQKLYFTSDVEELQNCNFYIIAVPTPVDAHKMPDLSLLIDATETVSRFLKHGDIVVYESTVYPGCTEEVCLPILEKNSGLKLNDGFFLGYSPERINPGDKNHTVRNVVKVVAGSTPEVAELIGRVYSHIVDAGVYVAPSIKVAEAAKVIENAQRDINIAFVNELAMIFNKMGIDTTEVLRAAHTKWNFLPFKPGLVGGALHRS